MKKVFIVLLLILFPISVYAKVKETDKTVVEKNAINLTCDKVDKINLNEEIICRASLNMSFSYNKINFKILNTEGIQIIDVRSNYEKRWKVEKNNNEISFVSSENQTDLQEFGIILIKAVKSGEHDLTLDSIVLENTEGLTKEINSVNQKVKIVSSDNLLKSIIVNDEVLSDFNSDKTSYELNNYNLDSIKINAESNNEFASIKGTGEFKLSDKVNKYVFPITVISEDNISKVYLITVTRNHNIAVKADDLLKDVIVKNDKGNTLLIGFKPDVFEYNIDVNLNTTYLDIKPTLNDNTSFIKDYGEQRVDLKSGNNVALVKVQNEDGIILTYVFNIVKPIANKSSNNYLKSLFIEGYKLNFSKRIKNYTLEINPKDTYLNITPIVENENAKYTISGNSNLKTGSVIKIEVTAQNEEKRVYKITIQEKKSNYLGVILPIIIIGLGLYGLYKYKKNIINYLKGIELPKIPSYMDEPVKDIQKKTKKIESSKPENKKITHKVNKPKANKPKNNTSQKNNTANKTNSKNNSKKTNTSTKKKTNNSASTRNPRNNYTKKKAAPRKKSGKSTNQKSKTKKKN